MRDFQDRVIWITGASSGIGKEMALQMGKMGAKVVLSARDETALQDVQDRLGKNTESLVLPIDMTDSSNFQALTNQVIAHFGPIDLLFHGAGISQRAEAYETELNTDRQLMEVNFFGNIALTKAVLPHMRERRAGAFCVISSIAGKSGFFMRSSYSASKHALHGFYESLRMEEYQNNIKVHIICPGPVNTNMAFKALNATGQSMGVQDAMQESGLTPEECVQQIIESLKREKLEALISKGSEALGMTIKALFPRLFFNLARRRDPRG